MKKTQKMLLWTLLAAMPVTAAGAETNAVTRAAAPLEIKDFEHYPSYTYDETSGKWSVHSIQADALVDRFWTYDRNNGETLCAFHLELEGNAFTGIWSPVLRFYYNGSRRIDASAVSILVGETRYDLAASSSDIVNGRYSAELISAPLTSDALTAIQAMIDGEDVSIRLIGENIYTAELDRDTTNNRRRIEAASLNTLQSGMELFDEIGLNEYALWDLSADAWVQEYDYAPAFRQNTVVKMLRDTTIRDDFGMIVYNDQTAAARIAQDILIESGFMGGSSGGAFGNNSVAATKRAQEYLGLIVTGCMDASLEQALANGRIHESTETETADSLGNLAQITLNRYWFADRVCAANATSATRSVFNSDNTFLAADGMIHNISSSELHLFMQIEAKVIYNETYAYEATLVCERDEGSELDTMLLPMAQSRLIVYAEVPASLMHDADAHWTIELTADGETLTYDLQ